MTTEQAVKDLSKGFVPVSVLFAIAAMIFWVGYNYANIIGGSAAATSEVRKLQTEVSELKQVVERLASSVASIPQGAVQRVDLIRLCLGMERLNKNFRCPQNL